MLGGVGLFDVVSRVPKISPLFVLFVFSFLHVYLLACFSVESHEVCKDRFRIEQDYKGVGKLFLGGDTS